MEYKRLKDLDTEIHKLMSQVFEMEDGEEKELKKIKITELMDERDHERKLAITGFMPRVMRGLNTTKSRSYYNHIKTRDELADDTPIFEKTDKYNEFDMEDLEDYLQEFFDKFSIIKTDPLFILDDGDSYNNYFVVNIGDALDRKLINREEGQYTQLLIIDLYNSAIFANLEFERIKPNIERRMGVKLYHSFNKNNFFYRLKIW